MKKSFLVFIVLFVCFSLITFGSELYKSLEGYENSVINIIDLLESGENEDAISAITELTDTLNNLKSDIISEVITSEDSIPVKFTDPKLEEAIREAIEKPTGEIYPEDLIILGRLKANHLYSLEGVQYCENLIRLNASLGSIKDISPLRNLKELHEFVIIDNKYILTDLSPLLELPNLDYLNVSGTMIKDKDSLKKIKEKGIYIYQ